MAQQPSNNSAADTPAGWEEVPAGWEPVDTPAPAPDFTEGEGGRYKMIGPDRKTKDIPYSNIMKASGAGWKMTPREREHYARDRKAEVLKTQPKISEQDYLKAMQLPEALPEEPGLWQQFGKWFQKETEPTNYFPGDPTQMGGPATGEFGLNTAKRVGRVLFGVPDFTPQAFSALRDAMSADPQKAKDGETRILAMHPGAQIAERLKELRDDYRKSPSLAAANLVGDVVGMWLAGKAMETVGRGAGNVKEYVTETAPMRSINKLIRPSAADLKFGKNPAQAILEEGIVGNDLQELGTKTYEKLHAVGAEIDRVAQLPKNAGKTVDVSVAIDVLDKAMAKALKDAPETYPALRDARDQLYFEHGEYSLGGVKPRAHPIGPRKMLLSPYEALEFKRLVGDKIRWTQDPLIGARNEALGEAYGKVKNAINAQVPELNSLNQRYANLVGAAKAIERQIPPHERNASWSLSNIVLAAGHHPAVAAARHLASMPTVRTRVARAAYGMASHPGPRPRVIPSRFGVPVTPPTKANLPLRGVVAGAGAVGSGQDRKELIAEAEARKPAPNPPNKKYAHTATGPDGHKVGTDDDGVTWFDIKTGQQVQQHAARTGTR